MLDSLLTNETTDYSGKFHTVDGAVISPQPLQKPSPPFTVGALGKRMLKLAAKYGDTWNTFGGLNFPPDQMYEKIKADNIFLDECCMKIDRDPESLRRSILFFGKEAWTLFDSMDNFQPLVEKYAEIGFTEFIMYYPWTPKHVSVFERIAETHIPELRSTYQTVN